MCCSPGVNSARHTSPSIRKFSFNPIGFEGPHTKQRLAGDSINDTGTFIRKKIGWISWALFQRIQTVITLPDIERRLANYEAQLSPIRPSTRQAAVAIILRERLREGDRAGTNVTDLLFIRRAEKSGDPWSGHMAFPGGHIELSDGSLLDAAVL